MCVHFVNSDGVNTRMLKVRELTLLYSIENEEHISGGTNLEPDLTFSPLQYTDLGVYQCKLSNPAGAGTSKQIELDVRCKSLG